MKLVHAGNVRIGSEGPAFEGLSVDLKSVYANDLQELIRNAEAPAGDNAGVQDETAVPISHFPAETMQPVASIDEQADEKPDEIEELDISSIE